MKRNFLKFLGGYLIVLLLGVVACCTFSSCKDSVPYGLTLTEESVDSIVHEQVLQIVNPVFTSVDEVLVYRDLDTEGKHIDSIFNSLPAVVLKNVAQVCINRDKKTSKRGVVNEYLTNHSVYDNLTSTDCPIAIATPPALEEPRVTIVDSLPPTEIKYSQHDTTIRGKNYKALIRQETKYEQNQ